MPDRASQIMAATDTADVATLALIEAVRLVGDNGKATNKILEGMQTELRDVRERVIRIEASELKNEVTAAKLEIERLRKEDLKTLDARVDALESDKQRRDGGWLFADGVLKYGPFVITLAAALFIILLATGRIVL